VVCVVVARTRRPLVFHNQAFVHRTLVRNLSFQIAHLRLQHAHDVGVATEAAGTDTFKHGTHALALGCALAANLRCNKLYVMCARVHVRLYVYVFIL
jgi:hypothetical protein